MTTFANPFEQLGLSMAKFFDEEDKIQEMMKEVEGGLPPVNPADAPAFSVSGALDDLIDWVSLIACRQSADEAEFYARVQPVLDLWDDVPYTVRGEEKPIAERRQRLLSAIHENFTTFRTIARDDRGDARIIDDFRTQVNIIPEMHFLERSAWPKALGIDFHVQEKERILALVSDVNFAKERAKERRDEKLYLHCRNIFYKRSGNACFNNRCACLRDI